MAFEPVQNYFQQQQLQDRIQLFDRDTESVKEAATWLGTALGSIAKSIVFEIDDRLLMVVCSSDDRIDPLKYEMQFGCDPIMLPDNQVYDKIGHQVGGVCPFVLPDIVDVYLDMTLRRFPRVYPAAGSRNSVIGLTPDELFTHSGAISWKYLCQGSDEYGRSNFHPSQLR